MMQTYVRTELGEKKSLTSHFHGFLLFSFFQFCAKITADYITWLIQCKKL